MATPNPSPVHRPLLIMTAFVLALAAGGFAVFALHRSSIAEEIPPPPATVTLKGDAPMPAVARARPIPPIDAEAPPKTETATFAMG